MNKSKTKRILMYLSLFILSCSVCFAAANGKPAVSPQDLLKPDVFPNAQYGMSVVSAKDGSTARVVTTGGEFILDKPQNSIVCIQRIAKQRKVSTIKLPVGTLSGIKLTSKTSGAAIFSGNGSIVRINCDSLLMIQPGNDGTIEAKLAFTPDYHAEAFGDYNFFDPYGGISFFQLGSYPDDNFYSGATPQNWAASRKVSTLYAINDPIKVVWPWKAGNVFWAAVSPPKPYNWKESVNTRIFSWGTSDDRYMYPTDRDLMRIKQAGFNLIHMHTEMIWENHQLNLVPKDIKNFKRLMKSAKELGIKVCVYASPHFFLKGTEFEHMANPDPTYFTGLYSGSNENFYLEQAARIVKEFGAHGLYFDEMYPYMPAQAANYHLARSSRAIVGDNNPLILHSSTTQVGDGHTGVYCPTYNAYFNVVWKGEGEEGRMEIAYVRYVLSQYNTSNAIGVQNLEDRSKIVFENDSKGRFEHWLYKGNIRFFIRPVLFRMDGWADPYQKYYWPKLTADLRKQIEPNMNKPIGAFDLFRQSINREIGLHNKN